MINAHKLNHSAVLFIPEAGIYPYLRGLSVLGDAILKQGGQVFVTHCTGQMLRCPMMAMHKMQVNITQKQKDKLCKICSKFFFSAQKRYKFSSLALSDFMNKDMMDEINNLINNPSENLENIIFRGFPVGKIAQYDFMLETKSPYSSKSSEEHRALFSLYIRNTALAIAITDSICERYTPSLLLTFNEYAQGQGVRYGAYTNHASRRALTYPVHYNIDTSRFLIWESTYSSFFYSHCQRWTSAKDIPILSQPIKECWNDVVFRLFGTGGSHIFSTKKQDDPAIIFNKLKLDLKKKTIVAYTSSQDERLGTDTIRKTWGEGPSNINAFPSQIEWLSNLRDYVIARDDIQIIVRIHPREGSRQFGFDSEHLRRLKAKFSEYTPNFIVVWPNDPISSYDLMELANVCLTAWSSMGHEAARLGIPVLSYTSNLTYADDDFIQVATTPEEYKKRLDLIINSEFKWQHLVKAVRFYHWRTFVPSLDLSETVPADFEDTAVWPEAPLSKVNVISDILFGKQNLVTYNIKNWQDSLLDDTKTHESEAMQQGIRFFLDKLFYPPRTYGGNINKLLYISSKIWRKYLRRYYYRLTNKKNFKIINSKHSFTDYTLEFTPDTLNMEVLLKKTKQNKNLRIFMADGLFAILLHKGKILRRMSPLVIRLAKLHDDSLKNNDKK